MTFTRDDVQRLAHLARLELSGSEIDLFARQLGDILEFARQIQAVDTASVTTPDALIGAADAMRDDQVEPSLKRDDVLAHAPGADPAAGFFTVPRVIKG